MDEATLKRVVGETIDEKLGDFFIEREQHYNDHLFVCSIREGAEKIKGTACGAVTKSLVASSILLLLWGIVHLAETIFGIRAIK